jgi:hypothetical protein
MMMAINARTCSVKYKRRDKEPQSKFNILATLCGDGELRTANLEYTVQQDDSVQFIEW